ncbi:MULTISPECIES: hypothetical protein [Acinetobacter]|uniref:Uncharacterized protein n=1 Tax=Acinetobacter lwoffii NIPH 478 TaxID=1217668 RepID=N9FYG5_ACILW|nr:MULTISPECIES: hypothetical protein [Acinetobacter]ENW27808.1 hypothetical protein F923_03075 [Acinetobacter lwoffii NIPH 478]
MATLREKLKDTLEESNTSVYEVVSLRVPSKIAAMIDIISITMKTPVASLLTDDITEALVFELLSDSRNIELINDLYAIDSSIISGGCLKILEQNQIFEQKIEFLLDKDI